MPTLKLTVFEPIEVEFVGKGVYKIESLSSKMLGDFQKIVDDYGQNPNDVKADQLADMLVLMLPGMTKEIASSIDVRHIVRIAEYLAEQITDATKPGMGKN